MTAFLPIAFLGICAPGTSPEGASPVRQPTAVGTNDLKEQIAEEGKVVGDKAALARKLAEAKVWTSADGTTLPYRLHLPAMPEAGRMYPLVVHLHGAGSRGNDNAKQLNAGGSDFLSWMTRRGEECVFLAPQCPTGEKWVDVVWRTREHRMKEEPTANLRKAMEIIADAMKRYPVDRTRVYVMGISMGGYATWELLQRHPDWFAAALPCCGGGDITLAERMKDVAIWVFHGEKDPVVPVFRAQSMVVALKRIGGNVTYREYPDTGHNAWTPTFTDDAVFDWLWRQRKKCAERMIKGKRNGMGLSEGRDN